MANSIFEIMGQKMVDDGVFGANAVSGRVVGFEHVADPDFADISFGYEMTVLVDMEDGTVDRKTVLMKNYKDVFEDFMTGDGQYVNRVVVR